MLEILCLQTFFWKTFDREMVITCHTPTLLQIFCELSLYCQVIFKTMRVADYLLLSKEQLNEEMSTWRQSFIQYFVYRSK